jgi:hypothetical protein
MKYAWYYSMLVNVFTLILASLLMFFLLTPYPMKKQAEVISKKDREDSCAVTIHSRYQTEDREEFRS